MASLPSSTQVAGENYKAYEAWFNKLDVTGSGTVQAGPAAQFLKKSGLNDNILSRIWDLSDPSGKGYLDLPGFFVSLKLIALYQNGKEPAIVNVSVDVPAPHMGEPPPHPPFPSAYKHVNAIQSVNTDVSIWTITPADRARYDQIFNSLGPEANKIHGNKVKGVMMNSKLPMDFLGKIWDLSDMDKDGSLDRVEFSIAMHLIYKVLENNQLPPVLPQEMLSSARRAGVAQGPVPTPLAPPGQIPEPEKQKVSGLPPAPWVVSAAEKAKYDIMFQNADLDKDGFVSGQEIKGIFLQSGLPQVVLAHIWNISDMKQTGKLTSEQFALAMWLIQQKLAGIDPPAVLTPEMIPPTMRPKPANDIIAEHLGDIPVKQVIPAKPQYSNPELQMVANEIEQVNEDKLKLEAEIQQRDASIRVKNSELMNLQTELDTLASTLKQLENQKGAAQKKLDDLGSQKETIDAELDDLKVRIELELEEVTKLREQVEEQESSLRAQEDEVNSKKQELDNLRAQEMELEVNVASMKKRIDKLSVVQQETQLHISQAKIKIEELQDVERHMTEVLTSYDSAVSSGDASSLSETSLREITPNFNDPNYLNIGPSPTASPKESPKEPQENGLPQEPEEAENALKIKDTSFVGGHDPFAAAFGGTKAAGDPFASWEHATNAVPVVAPVIEDPFEGDAFAAPVKRIDGGQTLGVVGGPPPRPASPSPALPPKKSKQPPPRPAPPKAKPVKPPHPQINSNNNPADPFDGTWNDTKTNTTATHDSGFADFANFAEFDNKFSNGGVLTSSPWGVSENSSKNSTDRFSFLPKNSNASPWPDDPFSSSFKSPDGFGSDLGMGSDGDFGSDTAFSGSEDPFGRDYDPFRYSKDDKFSWDDEPDPFLAKNASHKSKNLNSSVDNKILINNIQELSLENSRNLRSKSVLGDPFLVSKQHIPVRSQTSLGQPIYADLDFDPFSTNKVTNAERSGWKSNEDLLNENFSSFALKNKMSTLNNENSSLISSDMQLTWSTKENTRLDGEYKSREAQEKSDYEYALKLSQMESRNVSSRSPSTGL